MNAWFSETFVQCLGWTLVHFLWQGALVAALFAGFLRLARHSSANLRYVAGCLVLMLLAATPIVTFRYVSAQNRQPVIAKTIPPASSGISADTPTESGVTIKVAALQTHQHGALTFSQRLEMFFPLLIFAWLVGVFAFSVRLLGGWIQIQRLKRSAMDTLGEVWRAKLAGLALTLGIRRSVRLLQSALVEVPTVIGWLRPIIILPASCLVGLSPTQLESILVHELAHIRRHDYLVNLLQSVVETLLFYHPAVWWISRRVREEREHCCDDLAVEICGDRVIYARALAALEEMRVVPMHAQLALAASGPPLLPRIRRLAGQSVANANRPAWPLAGIIIMLMIALLALGLRGNRAVADENNNPATNTTTKPTYERDSNPPVQDLLKRWPAPTNKVPKWPGPNPVFTGKGRMLLHSKLDSIEIDSIKYDHLPFTEVINQLSEIAKSRDPDKQGVNFFIDTQKPLQSTLPSTIDPATGRPLVGVAASDTDIRATTVTIEPALNHLRLSDALDAIVRCADQPIAYSVLDYAVVFRLKGPDEVPFETRTFHVDPNTFRQGLEGVTGVPFGNVSGNGAANGTGSGNQGATTILPRVDVTRGISGVTSPAGNQGISGAPSASTGNATSNLQTEVRNFFAAAGVDLNSNNPANIGKMFIWNDHKGILTVRATTNDLNKIEAAIQQLNSSGVQKNPPSEPKPATPAEKPINPPKKPEAQVVISVKFVEIDAAQFGSTGRQWLAKELPGFLETTNLPPAPLPDSATIGTNAFSHVTNSVLTQFTGILTQQQFTNAIHGLEQRAGTDILTSPQVITLSGRQAQVQASTVTTVVTGLKSSRDSDGKVKDEYQTESLPFGPTLDVTPAVSVDGQSIEMKVVASVTEFLGYDDPKHAPKGSPEKPTFSKGVMPLPRFRLRQMTTDASVRDGNTLVLSGMEAERTVLAKSKVPVLGDVPLLGHLFRSTTSSKTHKNLLVFITPTIVNADGTRVHPALEAKADESVAR